MEICYDGALVMPKNYAVVNEEEMTYIEGGEWITVTFSRDFLRDCITAGSSFAYGAICAAVGTLGTPVAAAIFGAFGAAYGWIIGGSIARSKIQSDKSIEVFIPFAVNDIYVG